MQADETQQVRLVDHALVVRDPEDQVPGDEHDVVNPPPRATGAGTASSGACLRRARLTRSSAPPVVVVAGPDHSSTATTRMPMPRSPSKIAHHSANERDTTVSARRWAMSHSAWPSHPAATR